MKTQEARASETMQLGDELSGEAAATRNSGVTRRAFVGGMGAVMAAAAAAMASSKSSFADEAEEAADAEAEAEAETTTENVPGSFVNYPTIESTTGWTGTPEDVLALGVSTMPLEDLNQYRQAYLDAQSEYTCEDGTVVPAAYVKMRALVNSYGIGCGNTVQDSSFTTLMELFTEEEAEAYIKLPMGVDFTAYEAAAEEGIEVEEAEELCDLFASNGYLCAFDTNRGRCYHEVPFFQGSAEYAHMRQEEHYKEEWPDIETDLGCMGTDMNVDVGNTGTPNFYTVPVDASVTSDGTILPFDDLVEKVKSASVASISPCLCRYTTLIFAYGLDAIPSMDDFHTGEYEDYFSDLCDQRVETCISTGDEALYWIELGMGREITGEQAAEYLQRSVEDGFMLNTTFNKDSATVCSCDVANCVLLSHWASIGETEDIVASNAFQQVSHYNLEVDTDLCTGCGTCVDRCPMGIITINDEGWAEAAANCFRCGQCCYVCPQGARKLVQRDESELAPLPQNMLDDSNVKAAYRFEKGYITFPDSVATSEDVDEDETAATEEAEGEEEVAATAEAEAEEEVAAEEEAAATEEAEEEAAEGDAETEETEE